MNYITSVPRRDRRHRLESVGTESIRAAEYVSRIVASVKHDVTTSTGNYDFAIGLVVAGTRSWTEESGTAVTDNHDFEDRSRQLLSGQVIPSNHASTYYRRRAKVCARNNARERKYPRRALKSSPASISELVRSYFGFWNNYYPIIVGSELNCIINGLKLVK